jgi:hypothetical protein
MIDRNAVWLISRRAIAGLRGLASGYSLLFPDFRDVQSAGPWRAIGPDIYVFAMH